MQVQCILCDKIDTIDDQSFQAKRLLNRRIGTYLCTACNDRIAEKTKKRHATGKFQLYRPKDKNDDPSSKSS